MLSNRGFYSSYVDSILSDGSNIVWTKQKNLTETDDFLSIWRYFCWPGNMTQGEIAKKVLCDSSRSWIANEKSWIIHGNIHGIYRLTFIIVLICFENNAWISIVIPKISWGIYSTPWFPTSFPRFIGLCLWHFGKVRIVKAAYVRTGDIEDTGAEIREKQILSGSYLEILDNFWDILKYCTEKSLSWHGPQ